MKIVKYNEFLNENLYDTPEVYVDGALMNLKNKIDKNGFIEFNKI